MAATPLEASVPNSAVLFDIYNDGLTGREYPPLPGGPCNYVDLTPGANGARCGCRRFWSRTPSGTSAYPGNNADHAVWCMCSHHACFHDDARNGQSPSLALPTGLTSAGQENERPRTNREPLSPVQELPSFHMASNLGLSLDFPGLNVVSPFPGSMLDLAPPAHDTCINATPGRESTMPDTLDWNNAMQTPRPVSSLPPIPPQCLMSSQSPSTAQSSQGRYMRPFAGRGLQTLGKSQKNPLQEATVADNGELIVEDNGNAQDSFDFINFPGAATPRAQETQETQDTSPKNSPAQPSVAGSNPIHHLSDAVQSHEQRLDKLENPSFSVVGHDDCHEKHEHVDLRVTELESRVDEVEKRLNDDTSTVASGRRALIDDDATISVVSMSTNATARNPEQSEVYSQLQALQAQVNSLQASSLPSYNNPWELEVVFLPFPLKGIWMEAQQFSAQYSGRGADVDDWTQLPNTLGRQTPEPQSPYIQEWSNHGSQQSWLLPRACAPGRMIDKRLKSRGLIKTLSVKGSDARSLQQAMSLCFGATLGIIPHRPGSSRKMSSHGTNGLGEKFLGLQQPWIPLRKVHKDSRLRFLSPAEMLTPALWDVAFLMSSVVMKASGMHRLYITQPEAYVQDYQAFESGWSWHKLRELSRVYPDSQTSCSSLDVPEADAAEHCWAWNDRLDEAPIVPPPALSLRQTAFIRSRSSGSSQQYYTGRQSPIPSTSPVTGRAQSPSVTIKGKQSQRPLHVRTSSLPPAVHPTISSPAGQVKRRVASYSTNQANMTAYERRSSPFPTSSRPSPRIQGLHSPALTTAISKRRATRSPSLRPRTTPRWSMSRSPSLAPFPPPGEYVRGTTPFCYATPHSNAPPEPHLRQSSRDTGMIHIFDDQEDDDDMDYDGDDRGSSTDPYDSEMGQDAADYDDFEVHEDDEDDVLDNIDTDTGAYAQRSLDQRLPEDEPWPGLEDQMSNGENMDPMSTDEGDDDDDHEEDAIEVDVQEDVDDRGSQASSAPSEYPSTSRAWLIADAQPAGGAHIGGHAPDLGRAAGFKIHEDGDAVNEGQTGGLTQQW